MLAIVKDLFFVAKIRETARLTGVPVRFVKTAEEVAAEVPAGARFALLDLTAGLDYQAIFTSLGLHRVPVLGFTTHAVARQTQPWHARCERVVTKEVLNAELPTLLRDGIAA